MCVGNVSSLSHILSVAVLRDGISLITRVMSQAGNDLAWKQTRFLCPGGCQFFQMHSIHPEPFFVKFLQAVADLVDLLSLPVLQR